MTLVVVSGVGTGVGKTHVAGSLAKAWGRSESVAAYKPIESGVEGEVGPDEAELARHATFHVKRPRLHVRLRAPVSPHLAAREEGRSIDLQGVADEVAWLREQSHLIVELPGGLFTPLTEGLTNADLALRLQADVLLLVAPNRIGVLHDVRAVREACDSKGLAVRGVVLTAPATEDASSSSNRAEIARTSGLPVLAYLPRRTVDELVASGALDGLVRCCRGLPGEPASLE